MPLLLLLLIALSAGTVVTLAVWRYPDAPFVPTSPTATATEAVGHTLAQHSRLRRLLVGRLDPGVATGLALTLALGVILLGGLILSVLAYLVRSSDRLVELDESAAQWGFAHATDLSDDGLRLVTTLGETWFVIVAAIVLVIAERRPQRRGAGSRCTWPCRHRRAERRDAHDQGSRRPGATRPQPDRGDARPVVPERSLGDGRRVLRSGRARPGTGPATADAGAARGRGGRIAVAVAGSRVLLDVHWLSDVIAGLALGWAWFAVCSVAFGGRILRFGAAAERAGEQAAAEAGAPPERRSADRRGPSARPRGTLSAAPREE